MDFVKDYDFELKCHLGNTNKVADEFSRKYMHTIKLNVLEHNLLEKSETST